MKLRHILCSALLLLQLSVWAQSSVLKQLIKDDSFDIKYAQILQDPEKYHLQVIYTQINRDSVNFPHLRKYFLCPKTDNYFYPASLVKLPLAAMALEKIDNLKIPGLTKNTRLAVDSSYYCEKPQYKDTTAENCYPSIAHYIKKMLLVSDNYSYNRMYEFLTPKYINKRFKSLGYNKAMVNQRFSWACDTTDNRFTNAFTFLNDDSTKVIYKQPADSNMGSIKNMARNTILGKGYFDEDSQTVKPPKDFIRNNYIPFEEEDNILFSIIFPKCFDVHKRFNLTKDDYEFLHKYMSMLPRESYYPQYDQKEYADNYKKYIYFGKQDTITDTTVRSFNIVGRAYGFIADCAYIVDIKDHVEFGLSVLLYTNEKDVLNTNDYEYDSLALPFMSDLGHLIFNYEKKRRKKHVPNLSAFRFQYH